MKSNMRLTFNALVVLLAVCIASAYPQEIAKQKDAGQKSSEMQIAAGGNW